MYPNFCVFVHAAGCNLCVSDLLRECGLDCPVQRRCKVDPLKLWFW